MYNGYSPGVVVLIVLQARGYLKVSCDNYNCEKCESCGSGSGSRQQQQQRQQQAAAAAAAAGSNGSSNGSSGSASRERTPNYTDGPSDSVINITLPEPEDGELDTRDSRAQDIINQIDDILEDYGFV